MLTQRFTGQQQQYCHQPHRKQTKKPSITTQASPSLYAGGASSAANNKPDNANILLASNDNYGNVTIENIIDELMLVFSNKYWVVQCKYCDLISKLDFERLQLIYGVDRAQIYEVILPMVGMCLYILIKLYLFSINLCTVWRCLDVFPAKHIHSAWRQRWKGEIGCVRLFVPVRTKASFVGQHNRNDQ